LYSIMAPTFALLPSWEGTFHDSILFGKMHVCVSTNDHGIRFGQGVISNVGFMHGIIDDENVWTGQYAFAGEDNRGGSFSLTLNKDGSGFFGSRADSSLGWPVHDEIKYSSERISWKTPKDEECFRSDQIFLNKKTFSFGSNFEGSWEGTVQDWNIHFNKEINHFSSSYHYYVEKQKIRGYERGSIALNGIAAASNFYENGVNRGIDLIVQKNEYEFYATYWAIPSMTYFDYSTKETADTVQGIQRRRKDFKGKVGLDLSEKYDCLFSDYESREDCVPTVNLRGSPP